MPARLIGDGTVIDLGTDTDPRDAQIENLKADVRRLQRAVSDAELRAERAHEDAERALVNLRRQLNPLYVALQLVFGELDSAGITDASAPAVAPSAPGASADDARKAAVYDNWKEKLGPAAAKVIDALLIHGEMNTTQLAITAQMHRTNVPKAIYKLNQAGLVSKVGGRFSLKPI